MTIWIDPPVWPAHGRLWSHLVSDTSSEELHDFAAAQGIPRRGFEGDHYDVPQERYAALVAAGATPTSSRDLLSRLVGAGLRLRKRRGERGLARVAGVEFPDGSRADIDLVRSSMPVADPLVFAAMVVLTDVTGRYAVAYSPRREEWSIPGGAREPGESPVECAVREVREETGLGLDPTTLVPFGYERFTPVTTFGRWPPDGGCLQVYRASVGEAPELVADLDDAVDPQWVSFEKFAELAGQRFWWPLVAP